MALNKNLNDCELNIKKKRVNPVAYKNLCKQFSWTKITEEPSLVSEYILDEFAWSLACRCSTILSEGSKGRSQNFVTAMYGEARGISSKSADTEIAAKMLDFDF
jgi:hypothetical protein